MIKSIKIQSGTNWPKLLILWAIHWDEFCWTKAIEKIILDFKNKKFQLIKWSITFIPICNPKAYKKNKRYCEVNLNRVFKKHKNSQLYEEKLANILTEYVDNTDYILDIHSMWSSWLPFVFQDFVDKQTTSIAKSLDIEFIVKWWGIIIYYKGSTLGVFVSYV